MGEVGEDLLCSLCNDRAADMLDIRPIHRATVRQQAIEAFVAEIRDKWMTELIEKSGNVEFVNMRAAMLRQEAADVLEGD